MTQEREPEWMHDKRLRDEEARMVLLESNVLSIKGQTAAIKELFEEERKTRRADVEALERHERSDTEKFTSIDSRLQGLQSQLATMNTTLTRIDGYDRRITALEDDAKGRTAVMRWLRSAWVQMGIGGGIVGTLVAIYMAAAG